MKASNFKRPMRGARTKHVLLRELVWRNHRCYDSVPDRNDAIHHPVPRVVLHLDVPGLNKAAGFEDIRAVSYSPAQA
jgi:hypothetical protein